MRESSLHPPSEGLLAGCEALPRRAAAGWQGPIPSCCRRAERDEERSARALPAGSRDDVSCGAGTRQVAIRGAGDPALAPRSMIPARRPPSAGRADAAVTRGGPGQAGLERGEMAAPLPWRMTGGGPATTPS